MLVRDVNKLSFVELREIRLALLRGEEITQEMRDRLGDLIEGLEENSNAIRQLSLVK